MSMTPELQAALRAADERARQKALAQFRQQEELAKRADDAKLPEGVGLIDGATEGSNRGITIDDVRKAYSLLMEYKLAKKPYDDQIISNERWFQLRHWEEIRTQEIIDGKELDPEPTSAWLQNMISNKHADFMDNYPEPNVLEREPGDRKDAETLSAIIPVLHERNGFEKTYSDSSWYKVKHGCPAYGVFWDKNRDTIGDIAIQQIDLLNLFIEPNIADIQDSRNLFIVDTVDVDVLKEQYPDLEGPLFDNKFLINKYSEENKLSNENKAHVIDWYYKRLVTLQDGNIKRVLHFCKFVGDNILFASENDPTYQLNGWYDHGRYPIVLDPLFNIAGSPFGYGFLHIAKDPQLYIDKIYGGILQAAIINSKPRYFYNKNSAVNMDEVTDLNKQFVGVDGSLDEANLKPFEKAVIDASTFQVLGLKIDEIKATTSNEDVSRGTTSGGVTAAAAIAALQEAGNKVSRDMIGGSYRAFREIVYFEIELIRQFYDEKRAFRITGDSGVSYVQLDNSNLKEKPLEAGDGSRVPIFDIKVKAQKRNPFSKASQNELAKELYGLGFFNPQLAEQTLGALELMEFEGKAKVMERVMKGQTLLNAMQQLQQYVLQLAAAIQLKTGIPVLEEAATMLQQITGAFGSVPNVQSSGGQGSANLGYGERLAQRATPSMDETGAMK